MPAAGSNKNSLIARANRVPPLARTFRGNGIPNVIYAPAGTFDQQNQFQLVSFSPGDTIDLVAFTPDYFAGGTAMFSYSGPVHAPTPPPAPVLSNGDVQVDASLVMLGRPQGTPDVLGTTVPAGGIPYGEQARGVAPANTAPWAGTLLGTQVPAPGYTSALGDTLEPNLRIEAHFHNGVVAGFGEYFDPALQNPNPAVVPAFIDQTNWTQALAESDTLPTIVASDGTVVLVMGLWAASSPSP